MVMVVMMMRSVVSLVDPQGIVHGCASRRWRRMLSRLGRLASLQGWHLPHGRSSHPVKKIRPVFPSGPEFAPTLLKQFWREISFERVRTRRWTRRGLRHRHWGWQSSWRSWRPWSDRQRVVMRSMGYCVWRWNFQRCHRVMARGWRGLRSGWGHGTRVEHGITCGGIRQPCRTRPIACRFVKGEFVDRFVRRFGLFRGSTSASPSATASPRTTTSSLDWRRVASGSVDIIDGGCRGFSPPAAARSSSWLSSGRHDVLIKKIPDALQSSSSLSRSGHVDNA